jgi:Predicted nucleotide-binding protein containing TIR-like domain
MSLNRRVFISAPRDVRLDLPRIRIKQAIVDEITTAGYQPQMFLTQEGGEGLPAGVGWTIDEVDRVVRRCVGAVLIGLPFWKTTLEARDIWLPSDYCPYEGAVAHTLGLPILAISVGIEPRGVFDDHAPVHAVSAPLQDDLSWLRTPGFRGPFARWTHDVEERRDVFLGYCSKSNKTATQIQDELHKLGASVLNWEVDFLAGGSILGAIENARAKCSCGIFLFSEDDPLEGTSGGVAPRDNVVFEAGYFMSAKEPERCLIVRRGEAKMPADVGGTIYLHLKKSADVSSIVPRLRDFLSRNLQAAPNVFRKSSRSKSSRKISSRRSPRLIK